MEEVIPLYPPKVVYEQFVPLTFQLCNDRMADVRYAAVDPVKDLINCFFKAGQRESVDGVIKKCTQIRDGKTYAKRLLYIRICSACFGKIDKEIYDQHFFEPVLKYADDKIMNVRFCLSRFIKDKLYGHELYKDKDVLKTAIEKLKNDPEDVEVRRFFSTEDESMFYECFFVVIACYFYFMCLLWFFFPIVEKFLRSYKMQQPSAEPRVNTQTLNQADDDDSDSSLYSTSDDEQMGQTNGTVGATAAPTSGGDKNEAVELNGSADANGNNGSNDNNNSNSNENTNGQDKGGDSEEKNNENENDDSDSSAGSFEDEDDDEERNKAKETRKLSKKLSAINLESAKNEDNNPENAKGAGPDIADIGPDGRLVHQPTPFRLHIPADDDDDDDDDSNKDKSIDSNTNDNAEKKDDENENANENTNENGDSNANANANVDENAKEKDSQDNANTNTNESEVTKSEDASSNDTSDAS